MKSTQTRRPLQQHAAEKTDQPFLGKSQQKRDSRDAFFQAKKIDGNQDSALENEADAVAHQVVSQQQQTTRSAQTMGKMGVQKKGDDKEKEPKATQKKEQKDDKDKDVQKKGEEDKKDKETQKKEAKDDKDKDVQKKSADEEKDAKAVQQKEAKDDKDKDVQKKGDEDKKDKDVQKKEAKDEKEDSAPQKKEEKSGGGVEKTEGKPESNDAKFERLLNKSKGGGSPLPARVRSQLEHQMNANFEKVRIHSDQDAVELCNLSKAQAFTHGADIYFNSAKFDPESTSGMTLLAHELTHVIQQNGPGK